MAQVETQLSQKKSVFRKVISENSNSAVMDFHSAMHFIEGREEDERLNEAQKVFQKKLEETEEAEDRATCQYYLLRLLLREHLFFENQEARDTYQKMYDEFFTAERNYKKTFFKHPIGNIHFLRFKYC